MSKIIDPDNLSKFDRQYLTDRGIDPDEYAAKWQLDEDGELVGRSDYEEATPAEQNQVDADDPRLSDGGNPEDEDEDDTPDYSTWDAKALQAEIAQRNEGRDEGSQIVPEGTGKEGRLRKGDLVSALSDDDAANASDDGDDA